MFNTASGTYMEGYIWLFWASSYNHIHSGKNRYYLFKYSLIMYELSTEYLRGIFGIKECDLYAPNKRPIRCIEKAKRFNGETKRFTRSIAPTSATDYLWWKSIPSSVCAMIWAKIISEELSQNKQKSISVQACATKRQFYYYLCTAIRNYRVAVYCIAGWRSGSVAASSAESRGFDSHPRN